MPLKVDVPGIEQWDEAKEEFVNTVGRTLYLEHSLVSISKWEAKWKKPFLGNGQKTSEELRDYIRCMSLDQELTLADCISLPVSVIKQVSAYIEDSMTASWISSLDKKKSASKEIVTSELIYYWMIAYNIPAEYQHWHLNRLLMLIRICDEKNRPAKKMGKGELMARNRALNAERRARMHSKG